MKHPLVNASLAPYGFVFPNQQNRLASQSDYDPHWVNPEGLMAMFWETRHRWDALRPLPIETIIHETLPGMANDLRLENGDLVFNGAPYLSRDIAVLSAVVQWFGSSCGDSFLETFERPLRSFARPERHLVLLLTHTCSERCNVQVPLWPFLDSHHYDPSEVTPRDRALVEALMIWLGSRRGREFINSWYAHLKQTRAEANPSREMISRIAAGT